MLKRQVCCLVTALTLVTPYIAFAADPSPAIDTAAQDVLFKNGSKVRGQVVDIVPGDHVTLRFKNGEARRFEWVDVDRVMPASGPEPPPLPPAPPKPQPTTAPTTAPTVAPTVTAPPVETLPPATGPTVKVHINSPVFASLLRRPHGGSSFLKACDAPCDMEMPVSDDYMVSAAGSKTTPVKLAGQPGQTVIIDVDPPSDGGKIGGVVMIVLGAIGLIVGGSVDFVGLIAESVTTDGSSGKSSADGILIAGLVITGVSLGLGIGGLVVYFKSGNTDVTTRTGYLTGVPGVPTMGDDRFVRTPVWHTPSAFERAAQGPAAHTVPIFSHSF
jgi:hypothetical protein